MSNLSEFQSKYPSPMSVYDGQSLSSLPTNFNVDGKSLDNGIYDQTPHSEAYRRHPTPIRTAEQGNAFDFHSRLSNPDRIWRLTLLPNTNVEKSTIFRIVRLRRNTQKNYTNEYAVSSLRWILDYRKWPI
ncbi:11192_t:CDS:1 [Acaulospora colombiana]|uniref:11192_t:CDS:1 n=1 Tax=Acaulospora colombiana TaxID=27376 RepID=A0ACA9QP21_9GLOM|nr:11192_t:CDS:1 [Acaulospora colombiana]